MSKSEENQDLVMGWMGMVKRADYRVIADALVAKGLFAEGQSKLTHSSKICGSLVGRSLLVKEEGYYRIPEADPGYSDHSKDVTATCFDFIKLPFETIIVREKKIGEIALVPDIIVLVKDKDRASCAVVEVVHEETTQYLTQKMNLWRTWDGAKAYLSGLFGLEIPRFHFVTKNGEVGVPYNRYIESLTEGAKR